MVFRLTSIVTSNKTDQDTVLKHVKSLRPDVKKLSSAPYLYSRFITYDQILNNLNNLTHLLNLTVTNESDESEDTQKMSNASIDYGAEIFLFLNMHPSEWQYDFWFDFYNYDDDTFFSDKYFGPEKLLTLLKIKNFGNSRDGQQIANKMMSKLASEVGFQYYQSEMILEGARTEVEWTKNLSNVKGF